MLLGIEIGGTKLQLGVGTGRDGRIVELVRRDVDRAAGAQVILRTIATVSRDLIKRREIARVGIGFGGPVDAAAGRVVRSFQIDGWDGFPLAAWCQENLSVAAVVENDSNLAGLAEAKFGAGRGADVVFYSNVGSGIGGALVLDGRLYSGGSGIAVAEVGHLRPGPAAMEPENTVESHASGWALAQRARELIAARRGTDVEAAQQLQALCDGNAELLTGKMVMHAASGGNRLAIDVLETALQTYGWALAQVVTLLSPNVLVIGGGVAQAREELFLEPLRAQVKRYVMPPLRDSFKIHRAQLGEDVVVHGALALAAD